MKHKDEIDTLIKGSDQDLKDAVNQMDKETFSQVLSALSALPERDLRSTKFYAVLSGLETLGSLEDVGRLMTPPLFASLMEMPSQKASPYLKPLLVGMPSLIFITYLENTGLKSLENLRQEAATEPLHHHLGATHTYVITALETLFQQYEELKLEILNLKVEELTALHLESLYTRLDALYTQNVMICRLLDNMLLLGWNSGRSDLVETLSILKENASKLLTNDVGTKNNGKAATGLFYIMKLKLDSIFQKADPFGNKLPLPDDYPALEALSCLSLWYKQDYRKIGLISQAEEEKIPEEEIYNLAKKRLDEKGLGTVSDLKGKGIYSSNILQNYLTF